MALLQAGGFALRHASRALLALTVVVCAGCSSIPFFGDDDEPLAEEEDTTEQIVYRQAQRALKSSSYDQAIQRLQLIEARFPFGRYAEQAQLELIYANFMAFRPDEARLAADRFIRLHPQHPQVDYAYYLKGLAAFNKDRGVLDRILPTDIAKRDPGAARDSFADFNQLVTRFPDSTYAHDARQRMIYLRNLLAESEVQIARYYIRRGALIAAANRGKFVIENYPQTPAVPDALAVMIETYSKLEQPDLANQALRVLAVNHPDHESFDETGAFVLREGVRNRDRSWLNVLSAGLIDRPDPPAPLRVEHPAGFVAPDRPRRTRNEAEPEAEEKPSLWRRLLPFV